MQRSLQENDDEEHDAFDDGSVEAVFSFADQLEIGCSLARLGEDTRLQALEATECIIATNTRQCFRVSEGHIARFFVGEFVFFKDAENILLKSRTFSMST